MLWYTLTGGMVELVERFCSGALETECENMQAIIFCQNIKSFVVGISSKSAVRFFPHLLSLCIAVLMMTVLVLKPVFAQESTSSTAASGEESVLPLRSEVAQLDGLQIEYVVHRVQNARATIVFENGLMLDLKTWQAVVNRLADCCNLFLYNRPGIGRSTFVDTKSEPRHATARLQRILQERGLSQPYLLVGHSLGGQYAQAFATQYPEQVNGLLLVDALPLGVMKPAEEFPWYTRLGLWAFASKAAREEIANVHPMGEAVMEPSNYFSKPMIRILAISEPDKKKSQGLIRNLLRGVVYAEDFGVWAIDPDQAESRMNSFYPQAEIRHVQAHHRVQEHLPQTVVDAIKTLIDKQESLLASASDKAHGAARQ